MYVVYNALKSCANRNKKKNNVQKKYEAYLTVCNKYKHEIVAIQKYIPGWKPGFNIEY